MLFYFLIIRRRRIILVGKPNAVRQAAKQEQQWAQQDRCLVIKKD